MATRLSRRSTTRPSRRPSWSPPIRSLRDPFAATLSPRLPGGLNLGAQLFWLERLYPDALAARRTGAALAAVLGLGALRRAGQRGHQPWLPLPTSGVRPSGDSPTWPTRRGWAERLGPLRHAADVLGPVRPGARGRARPAGRLRRPLRRPRQQRRAARRARPAGARRRAVRGGLHRHLGDLDGGRRRGTRRLRSGRGHAGQRRRRWPPDARPHASWAAATTRAGWAMRWARPAIRRCSSGPRRRRTGPTCRRRCAPPAPRWSSPAAPTARSA